MDIRQSPQWGKYLSQIGWSIEKVGNIQIFIRPFPLIKRSAVKIQHPQNPLPLSKIDEIAKKYKALFVLIEPEPEAFNKQSLINHGFRQSAISLTHTVSIHIDLKQTEEKLLASFSENARRNIKKAQANNLTVKKIFLKKEKDDTEFKKFYALLANLTKLKKFYVPGYDEFYKKMVGFKDSSVLLFAFPSTHSTDSGQASSGQVTEPIAAVWLGLLKDTTVYMNTGITKEGYKLLANYLLVWEALKLAKKEGLKLFDFEGLFDPRFPKERKSWQKFSEFKKRFHGTLIEYPPPYIKWYSKPFKLFYLCSKILPR